MATKAGKGELSEDSARGRLTVTWAMRIQLNREGDGAENAFHVLTICLLTEDKER